jgi:branched-chain amino acid transport system permease protein
MVPQSSSVMSGAFSKSDDRMGTMTTFVVFAILGLGAGVAYAALAFGVVVVYKGSGVLNFAHGAVAMLGAYVYSDLSSTESGKPGLSPYLAVVIAMIGCAVIGVLFHLLVMMRLRSAPVLAKVVATLGLLSLLQGLVVIRWGAVYTPSVASLFPHNSVPIGGGANVGADRLWGLGLAIVLTIALWALYSRTRFGLATRASAENEKGAALLGYSPHFIASVNWGLGCALAALAGAIIAPIAGLDTGSLPLMILPAFAAALLGRFRSFGIAAIVALGIGITQSELVSYWGNQPGATDAVPLLVVILAMIVSGRLIPHRGTLSEGRPPKTPAGQIKIIPAAVAIGLGVLLLVFGDSTYKSAIGTSIAFAVLALSVVVLTGYVGQISLAQMTFAGLAGLFLSKVAGSAGVPFPLSIILAALLAVPVGVLVGVPAMRVRGINLAVVTLGLGYAVSAAVFNNPKWTGSGLLPGTSPVPSPSIAGYSFDGLDHPIRLGLFSMVLLLIVVVIVSNLRRSSTGRKMLAVRSNERAAAAAGISVSGIKLQAFAVSSFIAGLGGALLSTSINQASYSQFSAPSSIALITVVYISGVASIAGAILAGMAASGGLIYILLSTNVPSFDKYYIPISGALLIFTVMSQPDGAAPLVQEHLHHYWAKFNKVRPANQDGSRSTDLSPEDYLATQETEGRDSSPTAEPIVQTRLG